MDIQTLKINLARKILTTQDRVLLSKISHLMQDEDEKDWWDQLPQEVQEAIFEGMEDIEKGKVYTHEQVIQEAKRKYNF